MDRRTFLRAGMSVGALGVAGCTTGSGSGSRTTPTVTVTSTTTTSGTEVAEDQHGTTKTVTMSGTDFDPRTLSISPGTTVRWENTGTIGHTVTAARLTDGAASWSFASDTIRGGGLTSHTFEEAGVYTYYCTIHGKGTMCGAIIVGDTSMSGSLPCASEPSGGDGGDGGGYGGGDGGGMY
ncbi:MAG: plastocyanin/azurin family copper-binding protein [Halodesulfurarchaeum sp.]